MIDGWVDVGGIDTHYAEAGSTGETIVLLHGGGPGMSGEIGFAPLFAPLAARGFHVLAPDQLSMGLTDTRPHAWPTKGFQSLVDHVAGFIDALGLGEVSLVGHSQGSYVAAKYALDHPGRVRRALFLSTGTICSAMGIDNPDNVGVNAVRAYDGTLQGLRRLLASTRGAADGAQLDQMAELLFANASRPGVSEARAAFEAARDRVYADPALFAEFSLRDRLPDLSVPARFLWGRDDVVAPYTMARQLEQLLPRIPFTFFDGCGHNVQIERTDDVLVALFDLLDATEKA